MEAKPVLDLSTFSKEEKKELPLMGAALSILYEKGIADTSGFWDVSMNALMALLMSDKGLLVVANKRDGSYKVKTYRGFTNSHMILETYNSWADITNLLDDEPVILDKIGQVALLKNVYPQLIKPKSFIAVPFIFERDDSEENTEKGVFFLFDRKKKNALFKTDIDSFSQTDVWGCKELIQHISSFERSSSLTSELKKNLLLTTDFLVAFIEARMPYYRNHSRRILKYCRIIAHIMELSESQAESLFLAAAFHDVGMFGVDPNVLNRPEKLSKLEMREIQSHVVKGVTYLKSVAVPWNIRSMVYHHHERYDGRGYPDHLKEEDIPLESRIIAVADCYDSLLSKRPHRKAFAANRAILYMNQLAGNQLDPVITKIFLKVIVRLPSLTARGK